ncbi:hypothetical protein [Vreelandella arcis]|uniref:Uncharacterized protein n=1 Tax=Vreelandella arcis TaxID=416873 RepID=A0A1G9YKH1_9GAMM|nr:hypothetical protein [Halomonas arcis]SDN08973.1 hypothetical protein SAMN04487951_102188 [Halomonas arcis]
MEMIDQLNAGKTKAFAKHCFESHSKDELEAAVEGGANQAEMEHWGISQGEWEEAVAAALADLQSKG